MQIMDHYGKRLSKRTNNLLPDGLKRLLENYPDHGCYIDFDEARELFKTVRRPNSGEEAFVECLNDVSDITIGAHNNAVVIDLSAGQDENEQEDENEQADFARNAETAGTVPEAGAN